MVVVDRQNLVQIVNDEAFLSQQTKNCLLTLELVVLDDPLNSCSGNEIAFQWDGTVEFMQCSLWQGGTFFVFSLWKEQSDSARGAQSVVLME